MKHYLLIFIILLLAIAAGYYLFYTRLNSLPRATIKIGQLNIPAEVATTPAEQEQGLSGRASLPTEQGMLFVFAKPDYYQFWMPDMKFPIDIIWMNKTQVVDISPNVSNAFDAKNPALYSPKSPAQYVLEVNAGFAQKNNISIGDSVKIP